MLADNVAIVEEVEAPGRAEGIDRAGRRGSAVAVMRDVNR